MCLKLRIRGLVGTAFPGQIVIFTFRLRDGGGPYIPNCRPTGLPECACAANRVAIVTVPRQFACTCLPNETREVRQ